MVDTVRIQRPHPDLWTIAPPGAPDTTGAGPDPDTAVVEVAGGYLCWSLLADQRIPAATLHDLDTAQEWLWALYGAEVAVAADEYTAPVDLPARPERPALAAAIRRLGYAHWAARWWPASTLDGIAALDPELLDGEIAELTEFCEGVVDGPDAELPGGSRGEVPTATRPDGEDAPGSRESLSRTARAGDYALAAGGEPGARHDGLPLGRGSGGWDWRFCPAGVVDASEHAISWELFRAGGSTVVRIRAVAAPGIIANPPEHLWPHAVVRAAAGVVDTVLELRGDTWTAEVSAADTVAGVDVYVPGAGPFAPGDAHRWASGSDASAAPDSAGPEPDTVAMTGPGPSTVGARRRERIRELARDRLRRAAPEGEFVASHPPGDTEPSSVLADITPLRAEVFAAENDSDF
ncbi:hypothetical protein [Nocardia sp. X0981]